jgi:hypothetical protein
VAYVAVVWYGGGVLTVITAMVLYIALLGATLALRFFSGRWRSIDLVGEPALV